MRHSKYRISLGGVPLDGLDDRIYPIDIKEQAPKLKLTTAARPAGGLRLIRRDVQSRSVSVRFVLWERDKQARSVLYRKVLAWAEQGGVLTVGYREGQELNVICDKLPEISGREWDKEMELSFTAYDPYWRGAQPIELMTDIAANTNVDMTLQPSGTAPNTPLEFEVTNRTVDRLTALTVRVGGKMIKLTGLLLDKAQKVTAEYGADGYLRLTAADASAMDKRSTDSADELLLACGASNTVTVKADRPASVMLRAYPRWI